MWNMSEYIKTLYLECQPAMITPAQAECMKEAGEAREELLDAAISRKKYLRIEEKVLAQLEVYIEVGFVSGFKMASQLWQEAIKS